MVILKIGGNDIDPGMPIFKLVDRLVKVAKAILCGEPEVVDIASKWPRQDIRFNKKIKELEEIMYEKLYDNPQITYWRWDRRQPWRTVDRVHLTYHGYAKAIKYLMFMIL